MDAIIANIQGLGMKLSREEVLHIASLARLGVTEDEVDRLSEQLSIMLDYFQVLQKIDTAEVMPTAQPNALQNVTMSDEVRPSLSSQEVIANAPQREDDFFKVKIVLEE